VGAVPRGLSDVVLVGHSLGGSIIAAAAERLPGRVRGLVGVDTWSALGARHTVEDIEASVLLPEMRAAFPAGTRRFVELMCGPTTAPTLVERLAGEVASMSAEVAVATLSEAVRHDPEDRERALRALRAQGLPLAALSSATFRPKDPAMLAAFGIEHHVVPDTGHYLMLERPAACNDLLARVIRGWPAR
jgi:pimeloyl-ACP methyl ester carboxylesterase